MDNSNILQNFMPLMWWIICILSKERSKDRVKKDIRKLIIQV